MYCRKCGFEIPNDSAFCVKCGTLVEGAAEQQKPEPTPVRYEEKNPAADPVKKKNKNGLVIACAALVLALVLAGLYFFVLKGADGGVGKKQVSILEDKDKLAEISASVLKIECYDITGELYATGSGFVAFDSDLIVTNYHVIEEGPYTIKALTENGGSCEIDRIVACNAAMDIAVLQAKGPTGLVPLSFAEKPAEKTDKVVAIGSPLGLVNIVSEGIVSGFTQLGNESVIQFTASISHGSSGGVLLNEAGEVVGVTFASYSDGQNLNMAIPIQYVDALFKQSKSADALTVKQFYDTVEHVLPLSYVLEHSDEYMGKYVTVQAYISSTFWFYAESEHYVIKNYALAFLVENESDVLGFFDRRPYNTEGDAESCLDEEDEKAINAKSMRFLIKRRDICDSLVPGAHITVRGKIITFEELFGGTSHNITFADYTITY